ncbi:MAG: hypothetical protein AAF616_08895 [Bacteroidota bacterium]
MKITSPLNCLITSILCIASFEGSAQEPPHLRYIPHPLDTLSENGVKTMTIFYNDLNAGGNPEEKGIALGRYKWDSKGRIQYAAVLENSYGTIYGKDSTFWIYKGDSIIMSGSKFNFDPDYSDNRFDLDFSDPYGLELPPMIEDIDWEVPETISLMKDGKIIKELNGGITRTFSYDPSKRLSTINTVNQDRIDEGMGGLASEIYLYNEAGLMVEKKKMQQIGEASDTLIFTYEYDEMGKLQSYYQPSSLSAGRKYELFYNEQGDLERKAHIFNTFQSSGPPDYKRKKIQIKFETLYKYENGLLKSEKLLRDGEGEYGKYFGYKYNDEGLIYQKSALDITSDEPYEVFTYIYTYWGS